MKNKLTNDLSLLEEMIKDQNSKYTVDPFWKNYEYSNVTKIKHFDLKKFLQFSNSFGVVSSKRYNSIEFEITNPRISKPRVTGSNPVGRANKSNVFVNFTKPQY